MAILKRNNLKEAEPLESELTEDKKCSVCNAEASFYGQFTNAWFNLQINLCQSHMENMIKHNVELEKLQMIMSQDEEVKSDETKN